MSKPLSKKALERAIEVDKQRLQDALGRLGHCVKDEIDPRVRVANSPYRAFGIGFAAGFVLGLLNINR